MNTNSQIQFSVSGRWWQPNMETWRLLTTLPHIPPSPSNSSFYLVMRSKMLFFNLLTYLDLIWYKFPPRPRPNTTYPYKYCFFMDIMRKMNKLSACVIFSHEFIFLLWIILLSFFFKTFCIFLPAANYPFVQTSPKLLLRNLIMDLFTLLRTKCWNMQQKKSESMRKPNLSTPIIILTSWPVLDKSLDLEKFSKRNYSWFPLSSWRSEISCLVLLSIFKILKNHFSFSSRFSRFLYWTSLSPLDFQDFVEQFLFLLSIFKIL